MSKKNKKLPAELTFTYDEVGYCSEFQEYLLRLSTAKNPFECPNLRVLPKSVSIRKFSKDSPSSRYEPGDLLCIDRYKYLTSKRCNLSGNLTITKDGDLEAACYWPLEDSIIIKLRKDT